MNSSDKSGKENGSETRSRGFWLNPWFWIAVLGIPFAALTMLVGMGAGMWLDAPFDSAAATSIMSNIITGALGIIQTLVWATALLVLLFPLSRRFPDLLPRVEAIVLRYGKIALEVALGRAEESAMKCKPSDFPEGFEPDFQAEYLDLDKDARQRILDGWKELHEALNDLVQAIDPSAKRHRTFKGLGMHIAQKQYLAPEVLEIVGKVRRTFRIARALPADSVSRDVAIEFMDYKAMISAAIEKAKPDEHRSRDAE